MQKLTFSNPKGQQVIIGGEDNPFQLIRFEGFAPPDSGLKSVRAPFQHGATLIDNQFEVREAFIEFMILGKDRTDVANYRRHISQVFNAILGEGELLSEYGEDTRFIEAVADSIHFPDGSQSQGETFQRVTIDLLSYNPFWKDATESKNSLAAYRESLTLPFNMPALMGVEGQSDVIVNEGHVDTPVVIELYGPSTNPVVTNETTGEFIKVYRELASDEKLIIDTGFNRKRVVIEKDGVESNAYGYVDWFESSFIQLIPGENAISYKADVGTEDAVLNISYRNRYLGV